MRGGGGSNKADMAILNLHFIKYWKYFLSQIYPPKKTKKHALNTVYNCCQEHFKSDTFKINIYSSNRCFYAKRLTNEQQYKQKS